MTGQGHSPPQESPHFKQHQSSQELLIFDNSRQFSVNTPNVQLRLYYERFTLGLNTQKESYRCETGSLYTLQTCWGLVKQNIHIKSHKADLLLKDNPQGKVAALQCHILDLQGSGSLAREDGHLSAFSMGLTCLTMRDPGKSLTFGFIPQKSRNL